MQLLTEVDLFGDRPEPYYNIPNYILSICCQCKAKNLMFSVVRMSIVYGRDVHF